MGKTLGIINLEPFVYAQTIPVDNVKIFHKRRNKYPRVVLLDENNQEFEAEIQYIDENNLKILISEPLIFTVYIY